jgi:acyl-coenzyme A thioesterase PaaI-like protein
MRTYLHGHTADLESGNRLTAAVRFGEGAAIGSGHWLSAHGGAISTALDEATAELVKITHAPLATTAEISYKLTRPVDLNVSHRIECEVTEVRGGGLKIVVKGELFNPDELLCATCMATLANLQMLRK